jgi:DNA repair exonuclease SbcCD ATPase subunit
MKIVKLEAENVKRLKAVEITPEGNLVIIGGDNAQGKTSVLDSIEMVLAGEKSVPTKPIHKGESKARIVADLGDIIVKRTFSSKGSYLSVENKDGSSPKSPQAILDALVGKLSFDPLEFSRMGQAKQAEVLRELVGLDFTTIDEAREKAYTERTMVNRDLKGAEAKLRSAPLHEGVGAEVSVAKLAEEFQLAQVHNGEGPVLLAAKTSAARAVEMAEFAFAEAEKVLATRKSAMEAAGKALEQAIARAEAFKPVNDAPLRQAMAEAEETNRKARENAAHHKLAAELVAVKKKSRDLDKTVESCDEQKARLISAAKMPLEGLTVDSDGVSFNGIPFDQASSAEQLRVSVAIGLALNPKLKVLLIRDGSLLDNTSLKALAEQAAAADAQVWVERVGKADASAIIIEDGTVEVQKEN